MIKRVKFYTQKMVNDRGIHVINLHDVNVRDGYTITDNRIGVVVVGGDIPEGESVTVPWAGVDFVQEDNPVQAQAQGKGKQ